MGWIVYSLARTLGGANRDGVMVTKHIQTMAERFNLAIKPVDMDDARTFHLHESFAGMIEYWI
jgi:hypothetical protein